MQRLFSFSCVFILIDMKERKRLVCFLDQPSNAAFMRSDPGREATSATVR